MKRLSCLLCLPVILLCLALAGCPTPEGDTGEGADDGGPAAGADDGNGADHGHEHTDGDHDHADGDGDHADGDADHGDEESHADEDGQADEDGAEDGDAGSGSADGETGGAADANSGNADPTESPDKVTDEGDTDESAAAMQLNGENTLIRFTGVHTDPEKPDPRTGQFEALTGVATLEGGELKSINVEIETPSILVVDKDLDADKKAKLTNHLKSADFFNVNEYPTASFQSISIESVSDGEANITGDLTLLGTTKSITFPATVSTDDGLVLDATFKIDRTEFGMDYGTDNIKKDVEMTVKIPK